MIDRLDKYLGERLQADEGLSSLRGSAWTGKAGGDASAMATPLEEVHVV